jgi:hypothetical protein
MSEGALAIGVCNGSRRCTRRLARPVVPDHRSYQLMAIDPKGVVKLYGTANDDSTTRCRREGRGHP